MLRFLARDGGARNFADSSLRKSEQSDAILSFIRTWKNRTGACPTEPAFDRKLTTYANPARPETSASSPCDDALPGWRPHCPRSPPL